MRIYVDLDSEEVIRSPGVRDPVTQLQGKRAPSTRIEVQFTRGSIVQELPSDATGIFGVKESGRYDADYVAAALAWVKTGTGADTVYTFTLSLINPALNGLFFVDGNPLNDVAQVELMAELQWSTGGNALKTPTLTFLVDNDINRGGEAVPELPAIAYGVFLPEITGLTGGAATDLDALPTVALQTGYIIELLIDNGSGELQWLPFVLEPVAAGAGVVEPLDYDASTNDRRWRGATGPAGGPGPSGDAGQDAGLKFQFNSATSGAPGAGKMLFNNAAFLSATTVSVSETDGDGNDLAAFLALQDDGASANKCLVVARVQGGSAFFAFYLTGVLADNGAYDTFPIAPIAAGGTLSNDDLLRLQFIRTGDKGDPGTIGSEGASSRSLVVSGAQDSSNTAFSLSGPVIAGSEQVFLNGLLLTPAADYAVSGNDLTMVVAPAPGDVLRVFAGGLSGRSNFYSQDIGDGVTTNFTITHNLGTRDVIVYFRDNATNEINDALDQSEAAVATNVNQVTFSIPAPATNSLRVFILAAV